MLIKSQGVHIEKKIQGRSAVIVKPAGLYMDVCYFVG
jgi:delta-aminolevulinic acid dehydratase/porphobilinogen synthase